MNRLPASDKADSKQGVGKAAWVKWLVGLLFVAAAIGTYWALGDKLTLEELARQESRLRSFQQQSPLVMYALALLIYIAVTGLSIPGAVPLTLVYAWFFGFWPALALVSFASTAGATCAFLVSRFLFRNTIERRFGTRLETFNQRLEKDGPFYLFALRLVPAVPFSIINVVMGLTPIKTWTFWWVSQLGMLAGSAVYVYAGSRVPDLQTLSEEGVGAVFSWSQLVQIFVAFGLLASFPWIARLLIGKFKPNSESTAP